MNNRIAVLLLALGSMCASTVQASSMVEANIVSYGVYGNGNIWVDLDAATDQPGCSTPYLEFPASAPAAKNVFAIAALAVANKVKVVVQIDGCLTTGPNGAGTFTGSRTGAYFRLQ